MSDIEKAVIQDNPSKEIRQYKGLSVWKDLSYSVTKITPK